MRDINKFLILASVLLAACTTDPLQESPDATGGPEATTAVKICNTSDDAVRGTLIAKFSEEAIPALEQAAAKYAVTRAAMTRSGIETVDEVLDQLRVTSLKRVFSDAGEHEARTRAAGLHRWYVLHFDEDQNLDEAAERLAGMAEISTIQFSIKRQMAFDSKAYPFREGAPGKTRSLIRSEFNDPESFLAVALHQQRRPGDCPLPRRPVRTSMWPRRGNSPAAIRVSSWLSWTRA